VRQQLTRWLSDQSDQRASAAVLQGHHRLICWPTSSSRSQSLELGASGLENQVSQIKRLPLPSVRAVVVAGLAGWGLLVVLMPALSRAMVTTATTGTVAVVLVVQPRSLMHW
jgi:hypothetical protein